MNPYVKLEQNGLTAIFVHSHSEPPIEEIPLPFYRYAIIESFRHANSYVFYRLHYIVWRMEIPAIERENDPDIEPYFHDYQVLDWKEVEVKPHCVAGMIQLVDSMVGAEEFLIKDMEHDETRKHE